ncbi:cytidylyltransferase domain-containing protein [Natrinema salsiterrestre]|uniref:Acylneuraminate cytidylyltransferase family protein n=1 Tax=Natrinema salsiterrestre TaxID=2950540 RepID=A0A9Q4L1H7_9EURY|nr:acylneuraminate cytidylyltransferase family protein [Natrinema salsiterrestre]MDF9745854.1 acylneuraminate cytidylyltransferase family protein [Natrinema salsiterrestre]
MAHQTLAIIPARGGSKRVPRKNVREVAGKPLIAHTIEDASSASRIDRTIVSTDDEKIAKVAEEHGADVPFIRPEELATDTATLSDTVTHAVNNSQQEGPKYDRICILQVTSPLRTPEDIDGTLAKLDETEADSCLTISEYVTPPQWAVARGENESLYEFFDFDILWTDEPARTQDIPEFYHPNGAVFATSIEAWETYKSFYTPHTVGYEMPPERSFDVDEPWELELVRCLLE